MSGYRAALRIAWRDALRAKGRTVLVVCMIGLPVMAITFVVVGLKTADLSPRERLPYELGAADARITGLGRAPVVQEITGDNAFSADRTSTSADRTSTPGPDRPWTTPEVTRLVTAAYGPRARVLPMASGEVVPVATGRGHLRSLLTEVDLRDPLARGILTITQGRAPSAADEVALGPPFADRGLRIGDTVRVGPDGTAKRLVGFVKDPRQPKGAMTLALPGAIPRADMGDDTTSWLVGAGRPVTWADVREFNKSGLTVLSRAVVTNPPPASQIPPEVRSQFDLRPEEVAIIAMAVAVIVLEVVLLAGPAFAVGVRRRRRSLALIAATGGDARHLRAVVLAGGLVMGAAAAVIGAAAGIAIMAAGGPVARRVADVFIGPLEVPWTLVAVTMALGVGSGLIAAYAPARQAARTDVVAALGGRRERAPVRRGWPIAGAVLVAGGIALCLVGVRIWREFGAAFGTILLVIGCVMAAPWLVGMAGRPAGRLPLPLRLAVRDGARNRARSAPAVAAIMAAVAGITALAIANSSDLAEARREYEQKLPMGSATISLSSRTADDAVRRAVARELPGVPVIPLRTLPGESTMCEQSTCPSLTLQGVTSHINTIVADYVVGGAREARLLLGRDDPAVTAALAQGKVVLFGTPPPPGGVVTATTSVVQDEQERTLRTLRGLSAVAVPATPPTRAIFPPDVAKRTGLPVVTAAYGVDRADHRVTKAEQERLQERLNGGSFAAYGAGEVYVERGFQQSNSVVMLVLALAGAVMALGGSLLATGLSAADARPDLATLAAVGARPRTRRLLMMGQAGFVAALGCWLGIAAGLVPGIAVARPLTIDEGADLATGRGVIVDIPWQLLGVIGIVLPLIAMLVAALSTRSRLPATRRMAT